MSFKKVVKVTQSVKFPSSPLAIGKTLVKDVYEIETEYGVLRLLNATDCIRDRLMGYYAYDDTRCLEQAVLVALHENENIDLEFIRAWSIDEGDEEKYNQFLNECAKRNVKQPNPLAAPK